VDYHVRLIMILGLGNGSAGENAEFGDRRVDEHSLEDAGADKACRAG
jgi:hypothetical protein